MEILDYEEYKESIEVTKNADGSGTGGIFNVKRLVIGFAGGMIAAIAIYCVMFLISDKLQYVNDMKITYGITVFGIINYKKKVADSQVKNIVESVGLYCSKRDISNLSVLSGGRTADNDYTDKIVEGLKEKGITAIAASYSQDETDALKKAAETGSVLLVEKIEESRYSAIKRQIEMLKLYNTEIVGSVVISKY